MSSRTSKRASGPAEQQDKQEGKRTGEAARCARLLAHSAACRRCQECSRVWRRGGALGVEGVTCGSPATMCTTPLSATCDAMGCVRKLKAPSVST